MEINQQPQPKQRPSGIASTSITNELADAVSRLGQVLGVGNVPAGGPWPVPLTRLKIFGNRTRGSAYKVYIWEKPTTTSISFDASGAITESDYGIQGQEAVAINLQEIGYDTHDLTASPQYIKGFCWGVPSLLSSNTDGKPVFDIVLIDTKDCT